MISGHFVADHHWLLAEIVLGLAERYCEYWAAIHWR